MTDNTDSILNTIKKGCQLAPEYTVFDADIIIHTNTVFMILNQIGVGPEKPFSITDATATWDEFLDDQTQLEAVKSYMISRVKQLFDPPTSGTVMQALKESAQELEWRLNVQVDPEDEEEIQNDE